MYVVFFINGLNKNYFICWLLVLCIFIVYGFWRLIELNCVFSNIKIFWFLFMVIEILVKFGYILNVWGLLFVLNIVIFDE